MENITVKDVRQALEKIRETCDNVYLYADISDEKLLASDFRKDLHMYNGHIRMISTLCKQKHIFLKQGLCQCLPNRTVQSVVDTLNMYIREAAVLGVDITD